MSYMYIILVWNDQAIIWNILNEVLITYMVSVKMMRRDEKVDCIRILGFNYESIT